MGSRSDLLDAAHDVAVAGDWARVRMTDVAAAAGVSRQTLYNEFGSRDGLAAALAAREGARFLDGAVLAAEAACGDAADAVGAAVGWALRAAGDDPLVKAVLADDSTGLLPYLTTRSQPLLLPIASALGQVVRERRPDLDPDVAEWVCRCVVRLAISHLLVPTEAVDVTVADLTRLTRSLLT